MNFNLKDDNAKQDLIWLGKVFKNFGPAIDISKLRSVVVAKINVTDLTNECIDYVHLSLENNNYQNYQEYNDSNICTWIPLITV